MWWDEFETRLTNAFATINKDAGRPVYTNKSKLRMLNNKIRADFLLTMKTSIDMEMNKVPMTMTFDLAMTNYRNTVNVKFPDDLSAYKKTPRKVQTTTSTKGKGKNSYRNGKKGDNNNSNKCPNQDKGAQKVIGLDGKTISVHPAFKWDTDEWFNIPQPVRRQLTQMRNEYRESKRQHQMQETNTYYSQQQSYQPTNWPTPANIPPPPPPMIEIFPPPPPPQSIG